MPFNALDFQGPRHGLE